MAYGSPVVFTYEAYKEFAVVAVATVEDITKESSSSIAPIHIPYLYGKTVEIPIDSNIC